MVERVPAYQAWTFIFSPALDSRPGPVDFALLEPDDGIRQRDSHHGVEKS
jgi:hypothetical protein